MEDRVFPFWNVMNCSMSLRKKSSVIIQRRTYSLPRVTPEKAKFTLGGTLEKSALFFKKVDSCTEPLRSKKVFRVQKTRRKRLFYIIFRLSNTVWSNFRIFLVIISATGNPWDRNAIPLKLEGELVFPRNVTVVTVALLISGSSKSRFSRQQVPNKCSTGNWTES